jgi:hypothetical protein
MESFEQVGIVGGHPFANQFLEDNSVRSVPGVVLLGRNDLQDLGSLDREAELSLKGEIEL